MQPIVDAQGISLLQTKYCIPPLRREQVPRPQLIERLNAGMHRNLTLVSAPAGFGKTTLVIAWVNSRIQGYRSAVEQTHSQRSFHCQQPRSTSSLAIAGRR